MCRFHHSHDEEDLKGPRQGYFSQVAGRGASILFLFNILYYRRERERWTLSPRDHASRSKTSRSKIRWSERWSRISASRSLSLEREPENEFLLSADPRLFDRWSGNDYEIKRAAVCLLFSNNIYLIITKQSLSF
jgi:hypothetical protein